MKLTDGQISRTFSIADMDPESILGAFQRALLGAPRLSQEFSRWAATSNEYGHVRHAIDLWYINSGHPHRYFQKPDGTEWCPIFGIELVREDA